jgi:transposase
MGVLPAQAASIPEKRLHSEMSYKRLEQGQFQWPSTSTTGRIGLTSAQLAALLDGCEWRASVVRQRPELAG